MTIRDYLRNDLARTASDFRGAYQNAKQSVQGAKDGIQSYVMTNAPILRQRAGQAVQVARNRIGSYVRARASNVRQRTANGIAYAKRAAGNAVDAVERAGRYVQKDIKKQIEASKLRDQQAKAMEALKKGVAGGERDLEARFNELSESGVRIRERDGTYTMQDNVVQFARITAPGVIEGYLIDTVNGTVKQYKITRRGGFTL